MDMTTDIGPRQTPHAFVVLRPCLPYLLGIALLAVACPMTADAQDWEARATGEYTRSANESAELAQRLAVLDAQTKIWKQAVDRLMTTPAIQTLKLSRTQVSAYVAGLVEAPLPVKVTSGKTVRVETSVRLNDTDLAARVDATYYDLEAARDLLETWNRIERLQGTLDGIRDAAPPKSKGAKTTADSRAKAITALQINVLLAAANATLVRQETGTTSVPEVTAGALPKARALVERALMLDDMNADAGMLMGNIFLLEGNLDEPERVFRNAVRQSPTSALAHNRLGNVLYQQGRMADAEKAFAEAVRLAPDDPINHSDLAEALRYQDKVAKAIDEFQTAIRLAPHYMDPRHSLGIMLVMNQRGAEGLVQFREAIRVRPSSARGHYNAALLLADLEEDEESAKEWREAVRLNPNNYNAHYNFAEMLRLTGELEESAKEFRVYVERAPDTPATQRNKQRARTYIKAFEEQ